MNEPTPAPDWSALSREPSIIDRIRQYLTQRGVSLPDAPSDPGAWWTVYEAIWWIRHRYPWSEAWRDPDPKPELTEDQIRNGWTIVRNLIYTSELWALGKRIEPIIYSPAGILNYFWYEPLEGRVPIFLYSTDESEKSRLDTQLDQHRVFYGPDIIVNPVELRQLYPAGKDAASFAVPEPSIARNQNDHQSDSASHNRRGVKPVRRDAIKKAMIADLTTGKFSAEELAGMVQEGLAATYGGGREMCCKARGEALSEFVGNSPVPNSDK